MVVFGFWLRVFCSSHFAALFAPNKAQPTLVAPFGCLTSHLHLPAPPPIPPPPAERLRLYIFYNFCFDTLSKNYEQNDGIGCNIIL